MQFHPFAQPRDFMLCRMTCLSGFSAFSGAAVELRTDRHQQQNYETDGQNDKAVDGL